MMRIAWAIGWLGVAVLGCGGSSSVGGSRDNYLWLHDTETKLPNYGAFRVRWVEPLRPSLGGRYVPVEYASAGFDPKRDRIYIGSTLGTFYAFALNGRTDFTYEAEASIEAPPAVDRKTGEIFMTSTDGVVHALTVTGDLRWKYKIGGAIVQAPLLTEDTVYVVTVRDRVTALSRADGSVLWEFQGEQIEEFTIQGHAGLTLAGGRLLTGLTNGQVVALNPSDGTLVWDIDTSVDADTSQSDAPEFYDVDTTPLVIGDTIYVASFTTGLYSLDLANGSVRWRQQEFRGITAITAAGSALVISSGRRGVLLFDTTTRKVVWERPPERGAPTETVVTDFGTVLFGETKGSLIALALSDGREIGRAESGYGFSARPSAAGEIAAALSNSGRFLCLLLR